MSLIQGFEHDVFISYAHRDNESISVGHNGWVYTLHERLSNRLMQLLGEPLNIWRDQRLSDDQISDVTRHHLSKSATFIAIFSPAYIRSSGCLEELNQFHQQGNLLVDGYSRIFKVVKTYVPRDEHPAMLNEMLGYEFYEHDEATGRPREFNSEITPSRDVRYWERLDDLAWDIKTLLARMVRLPLVTVESSETIDSSPESDPIKQPVSDHSVQVTPSVKRNQVFISYSHEDIRWLERLQVHLKPLEKLGTIKRWDDTLIEPGDKWRKEIRIGLESARVAVLIISADFLASDFIMTDELPAMLAAAEKEGATILPLIVSPCRFEETDSLSQFQAVNSPDIPLNAMTKPKREWVFVRLVKLIENALRS